MTVSECLAQIDAMRPNTLTQEQKLDFISRINIQAVCDTNNEYVYQEAYTLPDDENAHLFITFPYDDIYVLYAAAQMDLINADMSLYTNDAAAFNERYQEYLDDKLRNLHPPDTMQTRWRGRWFA